MKRMFRAFLFGGFMTGNDTYYCCSLFAWSVRNQLDNKLYIC